MRKEYFIFNKNEVEEGSNYPTLIDLNIDGTLTETQNYTGEVDPTLIDDNNVVFSFSNDGMSTLMDWYLWHVMSGYANKRTKFFNRFFKIIRPISSIFCIVSSYFVLDDFMYAGKYLNGTLALIVFLYNVRRLSISDRICEHKIKIRYINEYLIITPIYYVYCAVAACLKFPNVYVLLSVPFALILVLFLFYKFYKYIDKRKRMIEYDIY